jgi:phosphinothricin acetyltransferase
VSDDASALTRIYNYYVQHSLATFETNPVSEDEIRRRVADTQSRKLPWLVAESDGDVVGYAYALPWKSRAAYRHTVEATIYLDPEVTGDGLGTELYGKLVDELRKRELHAVLGGISLPNDASIRLHEKLGFRKVGQLEQVGYKLNAWIDVGYWELLL